MNPAKYVTEIAGQSTKALPDSPVPPFTEVTGIRRAAGPRARRIARVSTASRTREPLAPATTQPISSGPSRAWATAEPIEAALPESAGQR